jgi:hypothetical protein
VAKANTPSSSGEKPAENPTSRASTAAAKPKPARKTTAKKANPAVKADAAQTPATPASTSSTSSVAAKAAPKTATSSTSQTGTGAKTSSTAKTAPKADAPKTDSPKPATVAETQAKTETTSTSTKAENTATEAKTATPATPSSAPAANAVPEKRDPEKRASVFFPLLLGGIVAGGIGFAAAELNLLGLRGETDTQAAIAQNLAALDGRIATLEQSTPETAPAPDTAAIDAAIADLTARVDEIANRPAPIAGEAPQIDTSGFEAELSALKTSVETQREEIQKMLDDALSVEEATAKAAQSAAAQTAVARIVAALSSGQPFTAEIAELQANGIQDVPSVLTDAAETGVATMTSLQTRFPDAARAALTAVRADAPAGTGSGLGRFLKNQLGARSVTPREGDDPDAILSRAEFAMYQGQLAEALAEVDALPDGAKAPLADWMADAQTRQAAQDAVDTLSQRLTAN